MHQKRREHCEARLIQVQDHLRDAFLPFWNALASAMERDAYIPYFRRDAGPEPATRHTAVAQCQHLHVFSALHRAGLGGDKAAAVAQRFADVLSDNFRDHAHAGWYWRAGADGGDTGKYLYAQAMAMLAWSEYAMASGDFNATDEAVATFEACQSFAADNRHGGYGERFTREWGPAADVAKSFRSHVGLMLAAANMYEATGADIYRRKALELLDLICARFVDPESGLAAAWRSSAWGAAQGAVALNFGDGSDPECANLSGDGAVAYGDNFEFAWAAIQVLRVTGADSEPFRDVLRKLYDALTAEAIDPESGGVWIGRDGSGAHDLRHEFAGQAAALAALAEGLLFFDAPSLLETYGRVHDFVFRECVDRNAGEWAPLPGADAGPRLVDAWKTGYHPLRALLAAERCLLKLAY